jgi:four helix bundle protein
VTIKKYQELIAWQKAIALVTEIYKASGSFPRDEIYGLTSQLRRAAVSVPSNVAEGQGRATSGEFIQFLCHARGSLFEVETQVIVAHNLSYLSDAQCETLIANISELGRILNGLITSLQNRKKMIASHQPLATGH